MLDPSEGPLTFLRFSIQRKKDFLRDIRNAFDGIVLTANILLYQYRSTPMVILGCRKPFFVDPISYLFGQPYDDFKQRAKKGGERFKPSFDRLMKGHGLDPDAFLSLDYVRLVRSLLNSDNNLQAFTQNALSFQLNNVWNTVQDSTDYLPEEQKALLVEDDFRPSFLIPPYFLYLPSNSGRSVTNHLNSKILQYCWSIREDWSDFFPAIFVQKEYLGTPFVDEVVNQARSHAFPGYCLWIDDFDERFATEEQIIGLIKMVSDLAVGNRQIVMLYGGFFSMLLHYFGVTCVCHGLSYGEAKTLTAAAQKGSGPAPVRYYILQLHRFLTLPDALIVLRRRPDLVCSCPVCQRIMNGNPERVTRFANEEELAEMHFLYNRAQERRNIGRFSLSDAIDDLELSVTLNNDIADITKQLKTRVGFRDKPIIDPQYLTDWTSALKTRLT